MLLTPKPLRLVERHSIMPSYTKTVCSQCGGLNGTKSAVCTDCQCKCPKCGNQKRKPSKQCKECYTAIQKSNPSLAIQLRTPQVRKKATKSLNDFYLKTGHSRAKQCPICNIGFIGHTQVQVYCSSKCAAIPTANKRRKQVEAICLVCGNTFSHSKCRIDAKYCSKACWSNRRVKKDCLNCGKTIESYGATKFCSKKCVKIYRVGENAPAWKDGKSLERERLRLGPEIKIWRKAVFSRDNHTCQQCGVNKELQAHHIKEWATHPDLRFDINNGVTLCIDCHGLIHDRNFRKTVKKNAVCPICNGFMVGRGKTCHKCFQKARKLPISLVD